MILDVEAGLVLRHAGWMAPAGRLFVPDPGAGLVVTVASPGHDLGGRRHRRRQVGGRREGKLGERPLRRVVVPRPPRRGQLLETTVDDLRPTPASVDDHDSPMLRIAAIDPSQRDCDRPAERDRARGADPHLAACRGLQFDEPRLPAAAGITPTIDPPHRQRPATGWQQRPFEEIFGRLREMDDDGIERRCPRPAGERERLGDPVIDNGEPDMRIGLDRRAALEEAGGCRHGCLVDRDPGADGGLRRERREALRWRRRRGLRRVDFDRRFRWRGEGEHGQPRGLAVESHHVHLGAGEWLLGGDAGPVPGDREREPALRGRGRGEADLQPITAAVAHHPPVERCDHGGPIATAAPLDPLDRIDEPPRRNPTGDLEGLATADAEITRRAPRHDGGDDVDGGHPRHVEIRPPRRHADAHPSLGRLRLERNNRIHPLRLPDPADRPARGLFVRDGEAMLEADVDQRQPRVAFDPHAAPGPLRGNRPQQRQPPGVGILKAARFRAVGGERSDGADRQRRKSAEASGRQPHERRLPRPPPLDLGGEVPTIRQRDRRRHWQEPRIGVEGQHRRSPRRGGDDDGSQPRLPPPDHDRLPAAELAGRLLRRHGGEREGLDRPDVDPPDAIRGRRRRRGGDRHRRPGPSLPLDQRNRSRRGLQFDPRPEGREQGNQDRAAVLGRRQFPLEAVAAAARREEAERRLPPVDHHFGARAIPVATATDDRHHSQGDRGGEIIGRQLERHRAPESAFDVERGDAGRVSDGDCLKTDRGGRCLGPAIPSGGRQRRFELLHRHRNESMAAEGHVAEPSPRDADAVKGHRGRRRRSGGRRDRGRSGDWRRRIGGRRRHRQAEQHQQEEGQPTHERPLADGSSGAAGEPRRGGTPAITAARHDNDRPGGAGRTTAGGSRLTISDGAASRVESSS